MYAAPEGSGFSHSMPSTDQLAAEQAAAESAAEGMRGVAALDPELAAQWSAWNSYAAGYSMQMAAAYGLYGAYGTSLVPGDAGAASSAASGSVTTDLVHRFIVDNHLDESAARLLRSEKAEIQAAVVGRGSLADCRNPSSAVMGRIRDAKVAAENRVDSPGGGASATTAVSQATGLLGVGGTLVDRFIADNRLDDTAARLLRCETPEIQSAVVERGSLVDCRNPSSAVMGRIRDAKLAARTSPLNTPRANLSQGAMDTSEVDRFIVQNRLDTGAARSLKEESADVQRAVMDRGSVADCTNPSAAIMGRINDAKLSRGSASSSSAKGREATMASALGSAFGPGGLPVAMAPLAQQLGLGCLVPTLSQPPFMQPPAEPPPVMQPPSDPPPFVHPPNSPPPILQTAGGLALPGTSEASYPVVLTENMNLEHFIREGRIDSSAEKALRGESPEIQMAVMMKGGLENCVNPSSAVMGRINEARQLARSTGLLPPVPQRPSNGEPISVDEFVAENRLDENAARALKLEPTDVQQGVIERGSLVDCFNASAAVMGRIRDIKLRTTSTAASTPAPKVSASGLPLPSHEQVEDFIRGNRVDENAARALRTENPEVQAEVLERGTLADCINASAAVMGRIRDGKLKKEATRKPSTSASPSSSLGNSFSILSSSTATSASLPAAVPASPRTGPVTAQEVEQFVVDNRLDDSAARALLSVPPDVQAAVMDRGSLAVTMNPSSAVMGRIRDAKLAANASRGVGMPTLANTTIGGTSLIDAGTVSLLQNYGAISMAISESLRSMPY